MEKTIVCKTDNFVSTSSGSNSSSTSTWQDLSSTSPAQERSDGLAARKRDDNRDSDDRLRDLPAWLEEFTDNLEDTEVHAPVHSSQDSDPERPTKVVSKSRKHSIYTHFPKRPKLRSLCANQNDKVLAENALAKLKAQSPIRCRCSRSCHSMDSIPICAKQRLHKRRQRVRESSSSRHTKQKVIYTDNSLEFEKACEDLSWNHRISTLHRSETNGIAERDVRRVKEGTSAVLLKSGLDGLLLLSAKYHSPQASPNKSWISQGLRFWKTFQLMRLTSATLDERSWMCRFHKSKIEVSIAPSTSPYTGPGINCGGCPDCFPEAHLGAYHRRLSMCQCLRF